MSRNNYLSDIKEFVKKKLLILIKNRSSSSNKFFCNEKFSNQINLLNSEKFTINNLINKKQYPIFDSSMINNINKILKNKLEKFDAKNIKIESEYFENLNYDTQNNLFNLLIENESCLVIELTDDENTSIINRQLDDKPNFIVNDCSKCFKRKILYFNCKCRKVYKK